jgi:cellulose synthase/poly-beta-1,6-N-acetylglucosamine synthase-like glycosyltransferase
MRTKFSVLIPAYNEEKNVGILLKSLTQQKIYPPFEMANITVIASGCTDNTEKIVKEFCKKNEKIRLISIPKRLGKANSINLFLKSSKEDLIVMISADVLPVDNYVINTLLQPFLEEKVGLVGGRPISVNPSSTLTNKISGLTWHLHHKISLLNPPKVGEIIAFRNVVERIPEDTLADEERLSAVIQTKGYKVVYASNAVVYNKSPERLSELIEQRKRIFMGHLLVKKDLGYTVPTLSLKRLLNVVIDEITSNPYKILTIIPLGLIEIFSRFLGFLYYVTKRYKPVWKVCRTTKNIRKIKLK